MTRGLGVFFCLLFAAGQAQAQCMRLVPRPPLPEPDGPGAFGPLQDTLNLDCLRFVRTQATKAGLVAIVLDEKGRQYKVRAGTHVGENTGRVLKIEPTRITIIQLVRDSNGEFIEVYRYLFLEWHPEIDQQAAARIAREAALAAGKDAKRYKFNENFVIPPVSIESPDWQFVFDCKIEPQPVDCGFRVNVDGRTGKARLLPLP